MLFRAITPAAGILCSSIANPGAPRIVERSLDNRVRPRARAMQRNPASRARPPDQGMQRGLDNLGRLRDRGMQRSLVSRVRPRVLETLGNLVAHRSAVAWIEPRVSQG
jgi:hypothetical protein